MLPAEVDDQARRSRATRDVGEAGADLAEHLHPLLGLNRRFFDGLAPAATIDLVEERGGAPDDVEVTVGHRVERTGAHGAGSWRGGYRVAGGGRRTYQRTSRRSASRARRRTRPSRPGGLGAARRPLDDHHRARHQPVAGDEQLEVGGDARPRRAGTAGPGRPRRTARPGGRERMGDRAPAPRRPSANPSVRAFEVISAAVRRSDSTSVTTPAPRDHASSPTAPEPAYRSRKRSPCSDPHHDSTAENSASRTRSLVGRVADAARRGDPAAAGRSPDDPGHARPGSRLLHELGLHGLLQRPHGRGQVGSLSAARDRRRAARRPPPAPRRSSSRRAAPAGVCRLER